MAIIDTDGSFESIQDLFDELQGLSYTDCSILELASRKNGIVVSSDKRLRNESQKRQLTIGGILWIIEILVISKIISIEFAVKSLKIYPEINQRVPKEDILNSAS